MLSTRLGLRSWIHQSVHQHSLTSRLLGTVHVRRNQTTLSPEAASAQVSESTPEKFPEDGKLEGWFYLDSVFPIRLATWECVPQFLLLSEVAHANSSLRHYIALFQEESLVEQLQDIFEEVHVHGFEVNSVDPRLASPRTGLYAHT